MNKGIIIAVVAALVIAGAGVFLAKQKAPGTSEKMGDTETVANNLDSSPVSSIKELMETHGNKTCTFSDAESKSSGEVFVGDGKMRGNFEINTKDSQESSHIIFDGQRVYAWSDSGNEGYLMSLDAIDEINSKFGNGDTQMADINKKVDLNCSDWSTDSSQFQLPTGVEFKDFSAMMESLKSSMPEEAADEDAKALQCEACDSLPDESAIQCKKALGC